MTRQRPSPPREPVDNPGLWHADDLGRPEQWMRPLPSGAVAELRAAMDTARRRGARPGEFGKEDFPLHDLLPALADLARELEQGRGFAVLRGFPMQEFSKQDAEYVFWGLTRYLGRSVPVNARGDLLSHVRDLGLDVTDVSVRNYQTREALIYHSDKCDVICLMCLRQARQGGESSVASAPAVHNAMLERCPELLAELYQPMAIDRREEPGRAGERHAGFYVLPVFSHHAGYLTMRYSVRAYYDTVARFPEAPPLSPAGAAALDMVQTIAREPAFHVNFRLQPGDMQFMNNYCVFHARTRFVDHEDPEQRRHLLRIWLATRDSRPLPEAYRETYGAIEPGALRGGVNAGVAESPGHDGRR